MAAAAQVSEGPLVEALSRGHRVVPLPLEDLVHIDFLSL